MSIKALGEKGLLDYLRRISGLQKPENISRAAKEFLEVYGDMNKNAGEEAIRIKELLISGSLKDFTELPPINGFTVLILASILDDETSQKARELISLMASNAGKARAAKDGAHIALNNMIEEEWNNCTFKQSLINKTRGYRQKFIDQIANKYVDTPIKSIEGRVDKKIKEEIAKKEK